MAILATMENGRWPSTRMFFQQTRTARTTAMAMSGIIRALFQDRCGRANAAGIGLYGSPVAAHVILPRRRRLCIVYTSMACEKPPWIGFGEIKRARVPRSGRHASSEVFSRSRDIS